MSRLLTAQEADKLRPLISNYKLNPKILQQFKESNFSVIAGPAGAGKDTLRNALIELYPDKYVNILSTTTRPLRAGEKNGVDYHFREVEDVVSDLHNQVFFQAALVHDQQISCLNINEVSKLNPGQYGVSILVPSTEEELRQIKPDISTIFLIPPSLKILEERILSERMLNQAEVDRRLKSAAREIEYAIKASHYYCIVSDTVEHVVTKAHNYLQNDLREESTAHQIMRQIMLELPHER